jgi:predicted ester cyclase
VVILPCGAGEGDREPVEGADCDASFLPVVTGRWSRSDRRGSKRVRTTEAVMQQAERVIREWFSEAWNNGNIEAAYRELVHPDAEFHTVGQEGGKLVGLQGFRQLYDPVRAAFSDINFVVQDVVDAGDAAAVRWTCTGRHSGNQMGFAPSGKTVAFSALLSCTSGRQSHRQLGRVGSPRLHDPNRRSACQGPDAHHTLHHGRPPSRPPSTRASAREYASKRNPL